MLNQKMTINQSIINHLFVSDQRSISKIEIIKKEEIKVIKVIALNTA